MAGQFDDLVGELQPGDDGWLPLDEAGMPTGPATKLPPPPPALACAVSVNATVPLPEGESLLLSESGAELTPPLQNNPDRRVAGTEPAAALPTISALSPNSAPAGVDLTLTISGTGLTGATNIDVSGTAHTPDAGGSDTSVSTTIPGVEMVAGTLQVLVVTPAGASTQLPLTVTGVAGRSGKQEFRRN